MTERSCNRMLMAIVLIAAMNHWLFGAAPVIGVALADGSFRMNANRVSGSATIFEGNLLETEQPSSSIRLNTDATMQLFAGSRSRLYQSRMVLEKGHTQIAGEYTAEALGLRIRGAGPGTSARIAVKGANLVEVAAVNGPVRVNNRAGVLVGHIAAGGALTFEPQTGAAAPATMTGCVSKSEGRYYLADTTAGVRVQIIGTGVAAEKGNRVAVVGTTLGDQQVQVNTLKRLSAGCTAIGATGAAKAGVGKSGADQAAGMAAGTKVVIAGVAVAAAGTTAGVYSATRQVPTPSSR